MARKLNPLTTRRFATPHTCGGSIRSGCPAPCRGISGRTGAPPRLPALVGETPRAAYDEEPVSLEPRRMLPAESWERTRQLLGDFSPGGGPGSASPGTIGCRGCLRRFPQVSGSRRPTGGVIWIGWGNKWGSAARKIGTGSASTISSNVTEPHWFRRTLRSTTSCVSSCRNSTGIGSTGTGRSGWARSLHGWTCTTRRTGSGRPALRPDSRDRPHLESDQRPASQRHGRFPKLGEAVVRKTRRSRRAKTTAFVRGTDPRLGGRLLRDRAKVAGCELRTDRRDSRNLGSGQRMFARGPPWPSRGMLVGAVAGQAARDAKPLGSPSLDGEANPRLGGRPLCRTWKLAEPEIRTRFPIPKKPGISIDGAMEWLPWISIPLFLANVLARRRGVRNRTNPPPLAEKQILAWADAHFATYGKWPTQASGMVHGAQVTWRAIESALTTGLRGLPGGASLARLLAKRRGVKNRAAPPAHRTTDSALGEAVLQNGG